MRMPHATCCFVVAAAWALIPCTPMRAQSSRPTTLEEHYEAAKRAQARQDYEGAIREWKAIVGLAPQMAEAHSNLGMMYYFARRPADAIAPFRNAIRLSPKLVGPHLFLGISYYLLSRPGDAIDELKRTLQLEPHNEVARKWLGQSYVFSGDLPAGIATLEEARTQDSKDAEILFQLARAYGRLGNDCLRTIRETWPDSAWDHMVRADQYRLQGRTEEGARHLKAAKRLDPGLARLAPGAALGGGESLTTAADRISAVQEILGLVRSQEYAQAYAGAIHLQKRAPDSPESLYALAAASRELAIAGIEAFERMEPESYRLHQLRAEYEQARENSEAAEAEYRRVLTIKPNALQVHLALGNLLADRKQLQEAIAEYAKELEVDPYSAAALTQMGRTYRYLKENGRAAETLKRSLAINPNSAAAHKELGIAYSQSGQARLAIEHLERANSLAKGTDDAVLFQLSRAYRSANQPERASEYQEAYLQRLRNRRQRLSGTEEQ